MRTFRLSLLLAGLSLGCGAPVEDSGPDEDVDSFSTTFPPVTTTSAGTTTATDTSAASTAGASTDDSTTGASGTDDGTSGPSSTGGDYASTGSSGGWDPLSMYDDEFDNASSLSNWTLKSEAEGLSPEHTVLNIGQTQTGFLTVRPTAGGWFYDYTGFFLYIELDGDFLVETYVNAGHQIDADQPPTRPFNSAGLLIRRPGSTSGDEDWLTHNVGYQESFVGVEGKTTANSLSTLDLTPSSHAGVLRLCKVGSQIVMTRKLDGDSGFTQTYMTVDRDDLSGMLQVGLAVGGWNSTGSAPNLMVTPDIEARFDYVRFRSITSTDDCLDP
jgi:hypothetical protein